MGYLISETTKEEREKIVAESLGNIDAACDGKVRICREGKAADIREDKEENQMSFVKGIHHVRLKSSRI